MSMPYRWIFGYASVTLSRIRATNELRFSRLRTTTKLSKFVGRNDFSTEHNDVSTDFDKSSTKMSENEQGKVRTSTDRSDLVRYEQTTNPLRSDTISTMLRESVRSNYGSATV
ncbi:hypothetical protein DPMN_075964 [Dreissena polymorpha]|uniref:Uncharacterized protein n=1 Tax=Dreissena polymorpha TaxID=45954 RepID=A0A9D4BN69_DREPO|nr:hypothetical protein DPMN_075964 [Dreissena polymorpha]